MSKKTAVGFLAQLVVWGLLLFGWGLDDLRGFFSHPARLGLLVVAVLGTGAVLVSHLDFDPFRKGEKPVGRQRWILAVFAAITLFSAWFMPFGDRRGMLVFAEADAVRYIGLALNASGGAIRLLGLWTLGKQFSAYVTLQQNHRLVQTGIYRLVRHPMYLGVLLALPGSALVFRSWLVIPLFVICAVLLGARIAQEEKLLAEHFGAEFEAYRHGTWRLLPYVY